MSDELYEFGKQLRSFLRGLLGVDELTSLGPRPPQPRPPQPTPPTPPVPPEIAPGPPPQTGVSPDTLASAEKEAGIQLSDLLTQTEGEIVHLKGVLGKGCLQSRSAAVDTLILNRPEAGGWPRLGDDPASKLSALRLSVFQGDLYSEKANGPVAVRLNPIYESVGREESLVRGQEYPKMQEFRQYSLFTLDLKIGEAPDSSMRITVGNKLEDPIWLRARLTKPMGEELPLVYELVKDRVPLWQWNPEDMSFYEISPITNEPATPVAYVLKEYDKQVVTTAWKRDQNKSNTSAPQYIKYGPAVESK